MSSDETCAYTERHTTRGYWICIIPSGEEHIVHHMRYVATPYNKLVPESVEVKDNG